MTGNPRKTCSLTNFLSHALMTVPSIFMMSARSLRMELKSITRRMSQDLIWYSTQHRSFSKRGKKIKRSLTKIKFWPESKMLKWLKITMTRSLGGQEKSSFWQTKVRLSRMLPQPTRLLNLNKTLRFSWSNWGLTTSGRALKTNILTLVRSIPEASWSGGRIMEKCLCGKSTSILSDKESTTVTLRGLGHSNCIRRQTITWDSHHQEKCSWQGQPTALHLFGTPLS